MALHYVRACVCLLVLACDMMVYLLIVYVIGCVFCVVAYGVLCCMCCMCARVYVLISVLLIWCLDFMCLLPSGVVRVCVDMCVILCVYRCVLCLSLCIALDNVLLEHVLFRCVMLACSLCLLTCGWHHWFLCCSCLLNLF